MDTEDEADELGIALELEDAARELDCAELDLDELTDDGTADEAADAATEDATEDATDDGAILETTEVALAEGLALVLETVAFVARLADAEEEAETETGDPAAASNTMILEEPPHICVALPVQCQYSSSGIPQSDLPRQGVTHWLSGIKPVMG
jgi:hypothetical protein